MRGNALFPFSFLLREQHQPGLDIIICSSPGCNECWLPWTQKVWL